MAVQQPLGSLTVHANRVQRRHALQYNPNVSIAFRDMLLIQIFQQRNRILSRDVRPRFEIGHREAPPFVRRQRLPDMYNHIGVKN